MKYKALQGKKLPNLSDPEVARRWARSDEQIARERASPGLTQYMVAMYSTCRAMEKAWTDGAVAKSSDFGM